MQSLGNVLFDSGWEIVNVHIREPGIFEFTDIETELFDHCLDAGNAQLHIRVLGIDLVGAVITGEKVGN